MILTIPKEHEILQSILATETIVQFIEAAFYMWLVYGIYKMKDVTSTRYFDWMITTPLMLLATHAKNLEVRKNRDWEEQKGRAVI